MIKLKALLKEIKISGPSPNEFLKVFLSIVAKKYPNSTWKVKSEDEIMSAETDPDKVASLSARSIKVPALNPENTSKPFYVGPALQDAFTKDYKGVLGETIKIHSANLLRKHTNALPALFAVGENWDPEAWEYIANKYNVTLITDDNWDEYVQTAEDEDDDEAVDSLLQTLP